MILLPFNRDLSFLSNFAKRTFTVNDQVKIINDFLAVSLGSSVCCLYTDLCLVHLRTDANLRCVEELFRRRI